ncbi:MAG: hypothetical protein WBG86_15400 [Polyangiales bacterium]
MSDTYNNVPMSDGLNESTVKADSFWQGPKLIVLGFVTLGFCFALLWAMAEGIIGPVQHEADYGHESHFLQPGGGMID